MLYGGVYATPSLELSIYSTCKRISQKLMHNVDRFLEQIYKDTKAQMMPVIRLTSAPTWRR